MNWNSGTMLTQLKSKNHMILGFELILFHCYWYWVEWSPPPLSLSTTERARPSQNLLRLTWTTPNFIWN